MHNLVSTISICKADPSQIDETKLKTIKVIYCLLIGDPDSLLKLKVMNILSPHIGTILCNSLTVKYFLLSKYWPVFVTTIENTSLHFFALLATLICSIKDNCCQKVQ